MMTLTYIAAAVVLLGLCIFIHELGHLLGGKMVGIKAKVFSMGYGKGVLKKKIGDTTYQVTLIPFGGYCQFYGEEQGEEREGKDFEFLSASPLRRIVVVAMGPIFNLLFGIILFYSMNLIGYSTETNRVFIPEALKSGKHISAAYKSGIKSGDRIVKINDNEISGFSDIQSKVIFSDGKEMNITVERDGKLLPAIKVKPGPLGSSGRFGIGVSPFGTRVMVGGVLPGRAAEKYGLQQMDEIISLDGKNINSPGDFTKYIRTSANKDVLFKIKRKGNEKTIKVVPGENRLIMLKGKPVFDTEMIKRLTKKGKIKIDGKTVPNSEEFLKTISLEKEQIIAVENELLTGNFTAEKVGYIGIYPAISPEMVLVKYGITDGFVRALVEPYEFIVLNIKGMGMLFSGKMNVRENLSGPIRIAKIAGDVAYYKGVSAFILLMAKISIILMVMNFLPIPVVDGGHLVFYTIEAIRGKPLNEKVMERIQAGGVIVLISIGVFVIINDISMLPFIQKLFN